MNFLQFLKKIQIKNLSKTIFKFETQKNKILKIKKQKFYNIVQTNN